MFHIGEKAAAEQVASQALEQAGDPEYTRAGDRERAQATFADAIDAYRLLGATVDAARVKATALAMNAPRDGAVDEQ